MKKAIIRCGKRHGHALPTRHIGLLRIEPLEGRTLLSGWGTADDFQVAPGGDADYQGAVSDAAGNVYVAGEAYDAAGVQHDIVRMKPAGSTTWSTLSDEVCAEDYGDLAVNSAGDLFVSGGSTVMRMRRSLGETSFGVIGQFASSNQRMALTALAVDPSGNLFVAGWGQARSGGGNWGGYRWYVLKGTSNGAFLTVDNFGYSRNADTTIMDIAIVPSGTSAQIYATGWAGNGSWTDDHLLVRKSSDGGATWQIVDDYKYDPVSGGGADGRCIVSDAAGNIYVAGTGAKGTLSGTSKKPTYTFSTDLVIRRSSNGGATWSNVDTAPKMMPHDLALDTAGNILLAAHSVASGSEHFIIRSNEAGAWHTVDDYQLAAGQYAEPTSFAIDPAGDVFLAGSASDFTGTSHAIVRSMSPLAATAAMSAPGGSIFSGSRIASAREDLLVELA